MTRKKDPFVSGWGWGSSDTQTRYSRASREYKCDNCGGVIKKGERYTATRPAFQPVGPYITHHWHVYPNGCKAQLRGPTWAAEKKA